VKKKHFSLQTSSGNTAHNFNYKISILPFPGSEIALIYLTIYVNSGFKKNKSLVHI
jgi:hypothetical protein